MPFLIIAAFLPSGCASPAAINHSPVISNLMSEKYVIFPLQHSEITCVASDIDGDNLTYEWSANGGNISGEGSMVTWIAPDAVGTYSITIAVSDGNGIQSTSYLSIEVVATHEPIIEDLIFTPQDSDPEGLQVRRGEICSIECLASDQDGDVLSYEWSASRGSISGEGPVVNWTAPNADGTYNITVVVTDGRDGESKGSLTIDVKTNHRPIIEKLLIIPEDRDDFNRRASPPKILMGTSCEIECRASDPDEDELTYEWSIDAARDWTAVGSIDEDDDIAVWTAPLRLTYVIVTVTVSDSSGATDTDSVLFHVVTNACVLTK
ncbi:Ig-like domain-containing protein [Chloroflexota bacterium]